MTRNEVSDTTKYTLNQGDKQQQDAALVPALKRLAPLLADEKRTVALAFVGMLVSSGTALLGPVIIGHTVDAHIRSGNFTGVLTFTGLLLGVYLCGLLASYYQTLAMGTVGRTVLFKLRNTLFMKLQELPL